VRKGQVAYHTPLDIVIYYTIKKKKFLRVKIEKRGRGDNPPPLSVR
jgi:lipoate-protein ligase B